MTTSPSTPEFKVFNTLKGQTEPFTPLDPAGKRVKMYVCGPTVYDDAHLGHARCYITWDVLYRFLKFLGYDVTYVRNVTDVDDKILNRAKERGETPSVLAERNYQSFTADMQALNVLPPTEEPRATQYISHMLAGIQALIDKGAAYTTPDGSAYFRVAYKADYGKLKFGTDDPIQLHKHLEDLQAGARVEVDTGKESPLDFALWKAVPLEDSNGWESPWPTKGASKGWGRPGWHMECSAMNQAVFGDQIDIHAGGADLIFPHHENEIAQSEAWTGHVPFAQYWMHNGFVNVSGEKMSKSLGNFSTVKKLLERYDANTIRYFLLTNHYRMPVDFNDEALQGAKNWFSARVKVLRDACARLDISNINQLQTEFVIAHQAELANHAKLGDTLGVLAPFVAEMSDDLNTAKGLGLLNQALSQLKYNLNDPNDDTPIPTDTSLLQGHLTETVTMMHHLGFDLSAIFKQEPIQLPTDEIRTIHKELSGQWMEPDREPEVLLEEILDYRKNAKAIKNWTQADAIRKHLTDIGLQLLDNKDGTTSIEQDGVEVVRA